MNNSPQTPNAELPVSSVRGLEREPRTLPWLRRIIAYFNPNLWALHDLMVAAVSVWIGYVLAPYPGGGAMQTGHLSAMELALLYGPAVMVLSRIFGLQEPLLEREGRLVMVKLFLVVGLASILASAGGLSLFYEKTARFILLTTSLATWLGLYGNRLVFWRLADQHSHKICMVGSSEFCRKAAGFVENHSKPVSLMTIPVGTARSIPPQGRMLIRRFGQSGIDELVIDSAVDSVLVNEALECMDEGLHVITYPGFVERHYRCVPVDEIDGRWFMGTAMDGLHPYYSVTKRILDVVIAFFGLLLSLPLLLVAMVAIRLESAGPVFYRQTRVGWRNRPFQMVKLRTMRVNAESEGVRWAAKSDERVTRVGKILRSTRIDEIPQFWNILRGEMAFIGPRPERPEFTRTLEAEIPFYRKRHMVKPGLTGWAQINYPYGASVEDARHKLKYDLYYVKHASLELDLDIAIRTIGSVMKGAR